VKRFKVGNAEVIIGKLPPYLYPGQNIFDELWALHPEEFPTIKMYNKNIHIPRWQQAYGVNYFFSQQVSEALPVPDSLMPYLEWAKQYNNLFNGILLNWYDSDLKHYIGKHKDSEVGLVKNSAIITISVGADRIFRMRELGKSGFDDVVVSNGDVIVIPWETNKSFTHEVPYLAKYPGKRISITIRAFEND